MYATSTPATTAAPAGNTFSNLFPDFTRQNLKGAMPGISNILYSIFGDPGAGYGDLEKYLQQGIGQQRQSLAQALGLLSPYQQGGATAMQRELGLLGQGGGDPTALVNSILGQFQQSPAQKATIQSGLEAVQNRLQAQGLGQSGAESKALEQFAQQQTAGQQQQFLSDVLGARGQNLSSLAGLAGIGAGAAGRGAEASMQEGTNISNLLASLGLSQFQQQQAGQQGLASGLGSLASVAGLLFL